ncbi:SET and MYND domain-containing protein 4 isoform X1 [Cucurbita pepo subsp. pepo]|uniref:SET and MYND domain-containing protein 4 isoform X1 n=2 Tax=Cucurbita pepo subsp. pepo TaxID=3664 RepID=UPI000C9D3EEB|nr:SET and MYND domain-containing protein 4 isoform X1 [Cucurbita pepo subsp. pepo]
MEKLKSLVPENLKQTVGSSTVDDLPSSCSFLLRLFQQSQLFFQVIGDLAMDPENALCGKKKDAALELKRQGNQCFLKGDYAPALVYYSQALQVAPMNAVDMDKNLVATLYVNRASVLLKMDLQLECLRDCNRALQISSNYAKAWYRRGKANASMGNFHDAIRDFQMSKSVEVSFNGKKQVDDELKIIQRQHKRSNTVLEHSNNNKLDDFDEPIQVKLHVTTSNKGRGMVSPIEIPPSSLVHVEEPYALVILKHCRETHCHYCLNELPADKVPCPSCSIPLYCSQRCQIQAGGRMLQNVPDNKEILKDLSDDLRKYVQEITLPSFADLRTDDVPEHKHECDGVHWPVILPSEIVLAGRIVAKFVGQGGVFADASNLVDMLNLSHHFSEMHADSKLECIIYSIILSSCLRQFFPSQLPVNENTISQIVILISQIRTNSISIVRMKSFDAPGSRDQSGRLSSVVPFTCNMEQVRVGQAIYTTGSLFNHSCKPNIHAYFNSRTLFIRTTASVTVGCPLELSYGPQVGQLDCKDRLKLLEDEYSFKCQCSGCSMVHIPDLVLNAFCCINSSCCGVVLDRSIFNCENKKTKDYLTVDEQSRLEPFMLTDSFLHAGPSHCLKCGSYRNIKSSRSTVDEAWIHFTRLQQEINSNRVSETTVSDALRALCSLKSTLHAYNKRIAEAEDNLSQAFCLLGKLELAADHCKASIRILEKLYGENHITIGNELLKLSSILLSVGDCNGVECIKRLSEIFRCHYGWHANAMFPFLNILEEETHKFVSTDV